METIQIISEVMTLADVAVKRAYFLGVEVRRGELEKKGKSKKQTKREIEGQ